MHSNTGESEDSNYFSILLPISVEARELLKVIDNYIYEPIRTSNTLQVRAGVWKFVQENLGIQDEFTPENSHRLLVERLPAIESKIESLREEFSQKFRKIISGNPALERLNGALQTEYQEILRNQLLFKEGKLQSSFLKKLWDNFEKKGTTSPIHRPIKKEFFIPEHSRIQ